MVDSLFGAFFSWSSDIIEAPSVALCTLKCFGDALCAFKISQELLYSYHEGELKICMQENWCFIFLSKAQRAVLPVFMMKIELLL
jgi:hypothetical protein